MSAGNGETSGTDTRRTGFWVLLGTAAVCVAILAAGYLVRKPSPPPPPAGPPRLEGTPAGMSLLLREYADTGNWPELLRTIERMSSRDDMLPIEQHDYHRLAPQTYERFEMHARAAASYREYLEWSAGIHAPQCRRCHTPPNGNFPGTLAEMTQSAGGERYVLQLKAAHQLAAETKKTKALVEKAPNDPGPRLVLYHLLRWGGDRNGAAEQAKWLQQCDTLLTASPANTRR